MFSRLITASAGLAAPLVLRGSRCLLFGALVWVTACSTTRDCATLDKPADRDWCWYEVAVAAAEADDLPKVNEAVQKIEEPMVRSAAVNKVLSLDPQGLDEKSAITMCDALIETDQKTCINTWKRPHLWTN